MLASHPAYLNLKRSEAGWAVQCSSHLLQLEELVAGAAKIQNDLQSLKYLQKSAKHGEY